MSEHWNESEQTSSLALKAVNSTAQQWMEKKKVLQVFTETSFRWTPEIQNYWSADVCLFFCLFILFYFIYRFPTDFDLMLICKLISPYPVRDMLCQITVKCFPLLSCLVSSSPFFKLNNSSTFSKPKDDRSFHIRASMWITYTDTQFIEVVWSRWFLIWPPLKWSFDHLFTVLEDGAFLLI